MRANEHPLPHFHAQYAEHLASIEIGTWKCTAGTLHNRAYKLVIKWGQLREQELRANWERIERGEMPLKIQGLGCSMKKIKNRAPARICQVKPLKGFNVELVFDDGLVKIMNLKKYLHGPAFERARTDPSYFRQVFIDPVGKTVTWPNTEDIDADLLRYELTPAWMARRVQDERSRNTPKPDPKGKTLIPKRVYLSPQQLKFLNKINPNPSVAIRQLIDTLQK